jgi:ADP-ribosylglycohydrolase
MLDQVGMVISFTPITDMISGSPFSLKSDQWTDDNSTTIRLAESLMECRGLKPERSVGKIRVLVAGKLSEQRGNMRFTSRELI